MSTYPRIPRRLQRPPPGTAPPPAASESLGVVDRFKDLLGLSALAAAVSYATLWLAYAQFYIPLGTTPEEAGIDKTELLTQALVGPAVLFIGAFILVFLYALTVAALVALNVALLRDVFSLVETLAFLPKSRKRALKTQWTGNRVESSKNEFTQTFTRVVGRLKPILLITAPATFLLLCAVLFSESGAAGQNARNGYAVAHPSLSFGSFSLPLVGIRAAPVTIHWKSDAPPAFSKDDVASNCLMHLGEADGKAVLYNIHSDSLIRIPSDDAVFELATGRDLPQDCRDPHSW